LPDSSVSFQKLPALRSRVDHALRGCAVGKVTMQEVMRSIWPFYGVMFVVLMLVTYIPAISLWLPRLLNLTAGGTSQSRIRPPHLQSRRRANS
jgi:hypothetical protein